MIKSKKENILFVYFDYDHNCYTPLDLAYVKACIEKNCGSKSGKNIEFVSVKIDGTCVKHDDILSHLKHEAYYLSSFSSGKVIFFLENIIKNLLYYEDAALYIATILKKVNPEVSVGLHSYKISSERSEKILQKNKQVDFIFIGESEESISRFVWGEKREQLNNFTYRNDESLIIKNKEVELVKNLDNLPSPYLSGTLDSFLRKEKSKVVFIATSRGCPFRCHYCFRGIKFDKIRYFSPERVMAELEYVYKKGVESVIVLDDNFFFSKKRLFELVDAYNKFFPEKKSPKLRIMIRPELVDEEVIQAFSAINVSHIQIGLQSINPDVQHIMSRSRNFNFDIFNDIRKWMDKYGMVLRQIDIICGLPGDNIEYFKKTINFAISLYPKELQVNQLRFVRDTRLYADRKKNGLIVQGAGFFSVPFVKSNNSFSESDMREAAKYSLKMINRDNYFNCESGFNVASRSKKCNNKGNR